MRQPKLSVYLAVASAALLAGVTLARIELVATGAVFMCFVLGGVLAGRPRPLTATVEVDPERVVEGEEVSVTVRLRAERGARVRVDRGIPGRTLETWLAADEERELHYALRPPRWGGYAVGPARLELTDAWGMFTAAPTLAPSAPLRVYPRPEMVRGAPTPRIAGPHPGPLASHLAGDGLELAGVRPFTPGDRARRVNWRATARFGRLYVTERLLERNAEIVLLLDTFAELPDTLAQAVRAADALAAHYLAQGARVGVVAFGGVVKWLVPASGARVRAQIVEALIETEIVFSYAWKDVSVLPRRALPPSALVLALTPLLDERGAHVLIDLRERGADVAAVIIEPFDLARTASPAAERLWRLHHGAVRLRLAQHGIATAGWSANAPLDDALWEVTRCRRTARSPASQAA